MVSLTHIIVILLLLIVGAMIEYYNLYKSFKKLENEITILRNRCSQLDKEVRAEANKNIILQSLINQKTNQ
jgi:hypothetical protein